MTTDDPRETEAVVAAATAGDEAAFAAIVARHKRELHVHCYRMLGSFEDAEDLVQETFLRAWRRRETYAGRSTFRAWLYRIATNACLDELESGRRRSLQQQEPQTPGEPGPSPAEVPWLQPYPDHLLEAVASAEAGPDATVVAKETIELAFLAAIQHLPPRQRAALVLRDVLGWSAKETAALLESSVASANSALQRARETLQQQLPEQRAEWPGGTDASAQERAFLERMIAAHETGDVAEFEALVREDIRVTMPPYPMVFEGMEAMRRLMDRAFDPAEFGEWRLVPIRANRQPATASYHRAAGDDTFRAFKIDVFRVVEGRIAEITTFNADLFEAFGLEPVL
jgi:RNA polymerase sigma-70 factor, ECF subfamily